MTRRKHKLHEFGGFSYAAGPGFPDTNSGRGYGRVSQGSLGSMRQYPQGYPYTNTLEDIMDIEDDEELEDEDVVDDEDIIKIQNSTLANRKTDATYNNTSDRRTFASSNNQGMFNYGMFGESNLIRLRQRSSEPSHGTMYGWSHPHLTKEPETESDEEFYRYADILNQDADPDAKWERQRLKHETFIRKYVRKIIKDAK